MTEESTTTPTGEWTETGIKWVMGYLKNNPNTIKTVAAERDYYKSRTSTAEDRVKDLEGKLVGAYTAFDKLEQRFETMWQKGPPRKEEEE